MKKVKKYAEGGELPQAMVDRMAREENEADRELIAKPLRALKNKVKEDLTGGAATGSRLNMGKLPGKAAAEKLDMKDASDIEKRSAAAYLRKGYSDSDAKSMSKQKAYKAGGSVKARGCGIATKGLTKGRMV
jgi:hypothetical protein